ncbi:MAG TPA: tRNA dihydrouridine synthase DusB [Methylocella sp.]|nr:tRNA dihydrouridine synthase DusB [Methylocella sp.]
MAIIAENLGSGPQSALQVGGIMLPGRAFLAPMAGVTDAGMRRLAHRFGASLSFTEMVAADFFARGNYKATLKAALAGAGLEAVQIAGCDPHLMAEAARLAEANGAALIDINMGCPAKKVTGGFAGSHLMRDLDLAVAIIRATVAAVRVPVSLKVRLGWDQQRINAGELGRRAELEGIAMLTVHGRTRCQFFSGGADWKAIGEVKEAVSLPVVANGDCRSLDDAVRMLKESEADAVMVGRAAIGQPWFVGEVAYRLSNGEARGGIPLAERRDAAIEHFETLLELFGIQHGVRHARKHLSAYARLVSREEASPYRDSLVRLECPRAIRTLLRQLFDQSLAMEAA